MNKGGRPGWIPDRVNTPRARSDALVHWRSSCPETVTPILSLQAAGVGMHFIPHAGRNGERDGRRTQGCRRTLVEHTLRVVDGRMMTFECRLVLMVRTMRAGFLLVIGRMMQCIVQVRNQSTTNQKANGEQGAEDSRAYDRSEDTHDCMLMHACSRGFLRDVGYRNTAGRPRSGSGRSPHRRGY